MDRAARILLDFIARTETARTLPAAYEVISGHKQNRLPKPLTSMTLDEVLESQKRWMGEYGTDSTAAGAYQCLRDTIRDLQRRLSLGGARLFNGTLQDELGMRLIRDAGYDSFMAGTKNEVAFGLGLARIWASLPVLADTQGAHRFVTRGQSYYEGDRLNKSLTAPESVEKMLREMRGQIRPEPRRTLWQAICEFFTRLFRRD